MARRVGATIAVCCVALIGCGSSSDGTGATPTTEPAPTSSAAPTTVAETTPPTSAETTTTLQPTTTTVAALVPLELHPISPLRPCQPGACPTLAASADGTLVAYDSSTNELTVLSDPPRTIPVEPLNAQAVYLDLIGPDDVAYLSVHPVTEVDPRGDLVAVSLSGDNAGRIVQRVPGSVDLSGDSDLVATAGGIVYVGCCGPAGLRPDPALPPVMQWVDRQGAAAIDESPHVSVEVGETGVDVVRESATATQRWTIPGEHYIRGMPSTSTSQDGGVSIAFYDQTTGELFLLHLDPDGSIVRFDTGRAGVAQLAGSQVVLYDGEGFAIASLDPP